MPIQVPDQFVPSVTQSPLGANPMSAQPVQPIRNAAPEQMVQMGQITQKIGEQVGDIGERIQNQMDDAMAKQAETKFWQSASVIANGDGKDNLGYLHTVGKAAVDAFPDASGALGKAKQDAMDGLSTDFQKAMFSRVASQHLISFGAQFADHQFTQRTQYAMQAAQDRAEMSGLTAANAWTSWNQTNPDGTPAGDFSTFSRVRDQEILAAVNQKTGTHDDLISTPEDQMAPQSRFALLQARSATARTAVAQMIGAQAPAADVQGFFDAMKAKGYIDARDEVQMATAVKSYVIPKNLTDNMNQAFAQAYRKNHPQTGTGPNGPEDYQGPIKGAGFSSSPYDQDAGGVHITVPSRSAVQAPGDGTVSSIGATENDVPFVSIEHPDGSTSTITGMTTFNVTAGAAVKMGQQIGTSGDAGGQKGPAILWTLADKNGAALDPTHAGLPAVDIQRVTDEKDLTDAIQLFRDRETNPDLQREGTSQMEGIVRHNQGMVTKATEQTLQDAQSQFYGGAMRPGGRLSVSNINPALFHSLTPAEQYRFTEIVTSKNKQEVAEAREAATQAYAAAAVSPEAIEAKFWLATHSEHNLADLHARAKYLTLPEILSDATKITAQDSKSAVIDHLQLQTSLNQAGLQGLFNTGGQKEAQKLASQQRYLEIQSDVQRIFDDAQRAKKQPLAPNDRKQLLHDYLINNQVMVHQPAWYQSSTNYSSDVPVNYANLTAEEREQSYVNTGDGKPGISLAQISAEQWDSLTEGLIRNGHAPTVVNIAKAWREAYGKQ